MPSPIPEAQLRATEERLGRQLPVLYRARMLRENGGEVEIGGESWFLFPIRDETSRRSISRTASDVLSETRSLVESGLGLPQEAVTIADNGAGDRLLLLPHPSVPDRFRPEVVVWRLRGEEQETSVEVWEVF